MRRLVFSSLILLTMIVIGSFYWLMATESGFKALINQGQKWLPELSIGQVQGRLSDEIQLHSVRYQADQYTVIEIDSVLLNWQLLDLLSKKLQLNVLAADGITISQSGNEPKQAATDQVTLPTIALPFDIYLDAMTISNVSMLNGDVTTPLLNRIDASMALEQSQLTIKQLALERSDTDHINIHGQIELTDSYATQLHYQWAAQLPNIKPLSGTGSLKGDVAELHLQQQILSPVISSQTIVLNDVLDNVQWQANIALAKLAIADFSAQQTGVASNIKLTAHGDLTHAKADLSATFTHPQLSTVTLSTHAESTDFDLWQISSHITTPTTMAINVDATLRDVMSKPAAQLAINWHDLAWPIVDKAKVMSSRRGTLTIDGNLDQFALQLNAAIEAQSQQATLVARAHGNDKKLNLTQLTLNGLGGKVEFVGEVLLQTFTSLNGQLRMTNINPGLLAVDWPGKLSGRLDLSASLSEKSTDLTVKQLDISGQLRDRPLALQGAIAYVDSRLTIPTLQLHSGQSTLAIKGSFQDRIAIDWQLNSPDLVDFYPDLSGELVGSGKVTGAIAQPIYAATLNGQDIAYGQVASIDTLVSELKLDMSQHGLLDAEITLENLSAESVNNINSHLSLSGTQADHELNLKLTHDSGSLSTLVKGGTAKQQWQGQLEQLVLTLPDSVPWTLTENTPIIVGNGQVDVGQQCLTSGQSGLCLAAKYSQQQWQADGSITHFDLSKLHGLIEQIEPLTGDLNGQFNIAAKGTYPSSGQGQFSIENGRIDLRKSTLDSDSIIDVTQANLNYQLTDKATQATMSLTPKLDGVSTISGSIFTSDIATLVESPEQAPLTGHFKTAIDDLSVFDAITADYENLTGQLTTDITLTGTVKTPLAHGAVLIDNASVVIPSAGLSLKQINAQAEGGLEDGFNLSFAAQSGKGNITGTGNVVFTDTKWSVNSHIKGHNFEVVNLPELYAIASPDMSITLDNEAMNITGSLTIPEADIQPTQFNSSVSASNDVVVITKEKNNEAPAFPTHVNVQLFLGDKINLTALGFKAKLTGDLLATGNASQQLQGKGQIVIKDGVYNAYGKKLTINDGKILFTGGPIDNPGLDIKAIKQSEDYLVGIQISGLAEAPDIKLFSDPSMSDDEILAYLVLGKPLSQASVADAAILASAAAGFGGNGEGIAQKFGLDKLEIEGEGKEDASVELGKNLSPNLYVGYGIGIFDPVNTVNIRYQLSKIWSLRAESGQESGIDLLYTHER